MFMQWLLRRKQSRPSPELILKAHITDHQVAFCRPGDILSEYLISSRGISSRLHKERERRLKSLICEGGFTDIGWL
jgi:hypothetical protein